MHDNTEKISIVVNPKLTQKSQSHVEECETMLIGKARSDLELQVCALQMKRGGLPNGKNYATELPDKVRDMKQMEVGSNACPGVGVKDRVRNDEEKGLQLHGRAEREGGSTCCLARDWVVSGLGCVTPKFLPNMTCSLPVFML